MTRFFKGYQVCIKQVEYGLEIDVDGEITRFEPQDKSVDSLIIQAYRGYVGLTAITYLSAHSISVSFLDPIGQVKSSLNPRNSLSGLLTTEQVKAHENEKTRFEYAKKLIDDKVRSQSRFMENMSKFYDIVEPNIVSKTCPHNLRELLLFEARTSQNYWSEFAKILKSIDRSIVFNGRDTRDSNGRNAGDMVNASLNYLYALIEHEVRASLFSHGFDVSVGLVHDTMIGKQPLAYDFQEPFRYLADMTLIELLEKKQLSKSDYLMIPSLYILRLSSKGSKKLIENMNYTLSRKVKLNRQYMTMRTLIDRYVSSWKKQFLNEGKSLNLPQLESERNMTIQLKEKIADMSYAEARKKGIGKSTLYYLKNRGQVKVYDKVQKKLSR